MLKWLPVEQSLKDLQLPPGYAFRELKKEEVPLLLQRIPEWYPGMKVCEEARHLDPSFYENSVFFREENLDKPVLVLWFCFEEEKIGFISLEKNNLSRTLDSPLGALAPAHRGGLGIFGPTVVDLTAQAIGAEMSYFFTTLRSPHQQIVAEKRGYQLVGILPASDREIIEPGVVKRVYEALYSKVHVTAEELFLPPSEALTPNTQRVWQALFNQK